MTVTVHEKVGFRMFPYQTNLNKLETHPPTITWLIVPKRLACEACFEGEYPIWDHDDNEIECPNCDGTGRPSTVEIVSYLPKGKWFDHPGQANHTVHGTVTLGEPVPVVDEDDDCPQVRHLVEVTGGVVLCDSEQGVEEYVAIGDQTIEAGYIAYQITPKEMP